MFKRMVMSIVICLGVASVSMADESVQLKVGMGELSSDVIALQVGFFANDKNATLEAVKSLRENVSKYLGDKETVTKLLPEELRFKSSIAVNSAQIIERSAQQIKTILTDRNIRMINKQMNSQQALLEIQNQCFRCHNLVRDWE